MENVHPSEEILEYIFYGWGWFGPIWIFGFGRHSGEERITADQTTNDALCESKTDVSTRMSGAMGSLWEWLIFGRLQCSSNIFTPIIPTL